MSAKSLGEPKPKLAILGGGGFVGARLFELAAFSNAFQPLPVLHSHRGLARLGAGVAQSCVIDSRDLGALTKAFAECRTVVNATMGDPLRILEDTRLAYEACLAAGVRQFIHLSSAVVFGRANSADIHDDFRPNTRSWMLYARGKAHAELWLGSRPNPGPVQIVVLRPGLIWGPGSNWSEMVGEQLSHGRAVLSNRGEGIANLLFVDNLVRMILAVACHGNGPSGFYNIGDDETVTWARYYAELAARLGYPPASVHLSPERRLRLAPSHALEWALQRPVLFRLGKWLLNRLGPGAKAALRAKLKGAPVPPGTELNLKASPALSRAHWELQNTVRRLPTSKFHNAFGPIQLISFNEALDSTAEWLRFAGYALPPRAANLLGVPLSV